MSMQTGSMQKTSHSRPSLQMYVEIPLYRHQRDTPHVRSSGKENTPLIATNTSITATTTAAMPLQKRKLPQDDDARVVEPVMPKKLKAADGGTVAPPKADAALKFPNGSHRCHQCTKQRDLSVSIQCTLAKASDRMCKFRFCDACLKKHYGTTIKEIKEGRTSLPNNHKASHVANAGYIFECPKCRGICTCGRCRKAKGLEPAGGPLGASKGKPGPGQVVRVPLGSADSGQPIPEAKGKATNKQPKKASDPLPPPAWYTLPVNLSLPSALSRMQIREFVLRFADVLDKVGKGCLEELECVAGTHARGRGDEDDEGDDCEWVSETCVKSLCLTLLGTIAKDATGDAAMAIQGVLKDMRSSSANLTKLWTILETLRTSEASSTLTFPDPLSPPTSASVRSTRTTFNAAVVVHTAQMAPVLAALCDRAVECQSVRNELEEAVREGRERTREMRESAKKEIERWDGEKQSWMSKHPTDNTGKPPKIDAEFKELRAKHKENLLSLEQSLRVAIPAYAPRFGPLGRDADGRVYWALSPSLGEREAAEDYLAVRAGIISSQQAKGRLAKHKRAATEEERRGMKRWGWFVAVWGKRPDDADVRFLSTEKPSMDSKIDNEGHENGHESDQGEDNGKEKWWGFWEPEEIRRLAAFIGRRGGLSQGDDTDESDSLSSHSSAKNSDRDNGSASTLSSGPANVDSPAPRKGDLKQLIKRLQEYADLLEWRIKRDDGDA